MSFFETLIAAPGSSSELAHALAIAGAVEASAQATGDPAALVEMDRNCVAWTLPGQAAEARFQGQSLTEIARAWTTLVGPYSDSAVRLLWHYDRHREDAAAVADRVWPILGAGAWTHGSAPSIFHVALDRSGTDFPWSWPPALDMEARIAQAQAAKPGTMLGRGLAQIWEPGLPSGGPDYRLLSGDASYPGRVIGGGPAGTSPGLDMTLLPSAGPVDRPALLDGLLDAHGLSGRPIAALPIEMGRVQDFTDVFTEELTHDFAPDMVLARSMPGFASGTDLPYPVVVVGTVQQLPFELERARAHERLQDVLTRIENLPGDLPLPPSFGRLQNTFPGMAGPRTINGLRAALRQVVRDPQYYFMHESDAASDIRDIQSVVQEIATQFEPPSAAAASIGSVFDLDDDLDLGAEDFAPRASEAPELYPSAEPDPEPEVYPSAAPEPEAAPTAEPAAEPEVYPSSGPEIFPAPDAEPEAGEAPEEAYFELTGDFGVEEDAAEEAAEDAAAVEDFAAEEAAEEAAPEDLPAAAAPAEAAPLEDAGGGDEVPKEKERALDVTVYPGEGYDEDALPADAVFESFAKYAVGLAIRAERSGVDAAKPARTIKPPRQARETVRLWVVVATPTPDLVDLPEPIAEIKWPYNRDTEEIFVPFTLKDAVDEQSPEIDIRIYGEGLNFLEQVRLVGLAIGAPSEMRLERPDLVPADYSAQANKDRIDLQIHEDSVGNHCRITLLAHPPDGSAKVNLLTRTVSSADALHSLAQIRETTEKLVTGVFQAREGLSKSTLDRRILPDMARMGEQAWKMLFGGVNSGISKLVRSLDGDPGLRIQITTSDQAGSFVFPWAFLRPPLGFRETPDWDAFWGLRHEIEIWPGSFRSAGLAAAPVSVAMAEDDKFTELATHRVHLQQLAQDHGIALEEPASDVNALYQRLRHDPAHLYYFFCHGFAPSPFELPRSVQTSLEEAGLAHERVSGEAIISFTGGELTETELATLEAYRRRRPIFFLNMCQSAELTPGQSGGLVRVLLEVGAATVLGTEAEMTAVFAGKFAEDVLGGMFSGDTIGAAVLAARHKALERGNPLGLAYSLYGRGDLRLGPPSS